MTLFSPISMGFELQNPRVLVEMIDTMLFLANKGVDIFRLDAVAYMWKDIGRFNQNLPEVHTLYKFLNCADKLYLLELLTLPKQ